MEDPKETARTLLRYYAEALTNFANAETEEVQEEFIAEADLITFQIEGDYAQEIAQLIFELLGSEPLPDSR